MASTAELIAKYTALGLTDAESYVTNKGKFDETAAQKSIIKDLYKLDPAQYTGKKGVINFDAAKTKYEYELPRIVRPTTEPSNFTQAVNNYSSALSAIQSAGVGKINSKDYASLQALAKQLRDFDSKDLSPNARQIIASSQQSIDAINEIKNQEDKVARQAANRTRVPKGPQRQSEQGKLLVEEDKLARLAAAADQATPTYIESFSRFGLSDVAQGIGATPAGVGRVAAGLEALRGDNVLQTGGLASKLNIQVTDDQILNDINTARRNQYKSLADIGTAAVTDLNSQLTQANQFLADLPAGDRRRINTQKTIDSISTQLASAQKDTLEAQKLYEGYQPISGEVATSALSKFRESLRLPEERTINQIEQIDPTIGATVRGLSRQYQTMAETPLGPTTTQQTEELRSTIEQEALNQLRLGSTIGAEERRGYEQAARAAQTARGNIFGLGPAVQEAASIGAAGEQRKLARYGAAAAFLGSGETTGAATARDLGLRNALEQSRLGAAQGFVAGGPTMYNLASQRLGAQQSMLNNYLAASQPQQTGGFQATPSAANPYAYVNPNAGFVGAQNASNIFGTLANIYNTQAGYLEGTYGAQVGAQSRQPNGFQNFATLAGGVKDLAGAAGGLASAGILCWVAREVYGIDNPKWMQFREWMLTKASDNLRNFYIKYGERIAESIRNKPKIKAIIRKWMDSKIG